MPKTDTYITSHCNLHLHLGPLVHIEHKGPYDGIATLIGLVSWGAACGYPQYPDVYARVSIVLDWIHAETGNINTLIVLLIRQILLILSCNC